MPYPKLLTRTLPLAFLAIFLLLHNKQGSRSFGKAEESIALGSLPTRQFHAGVWNQAARSQIVASKASDTKRSANDDLGDRQDHSLGEFDASTSQASNGTGHGNSRNSYSSSSSSSSKSINPSSIKNSYKSKDSHDAGAAGNADSNMDPADHNSKGAPNSEAGKGAVLPGQPVAPFTVDTPMGPFHYDPATSKLPVVVMVLNTEDPFQRAMWSAWSLQMFLRQAPLAAADYLFLPYTYTPAAAADVAYYMYREMIAAARDVYGSDDTTDEDLRKRVLHHVHFSTTPATAISPQIVLLLHQWTQDMKTLHARMSPSSQPPSSPSAQAAAARSAPAPASASAPAAASTATAAEDIPATNAEAHSATALPAVRAADWHAPEADGLTVGRLDAWYGWLPNPATVSPDPAPLVAFEDISRGSTASTVRSPCDPLNVTETNATSVDSGGGDGVGGSGGSSGRLSGAWVLIPNATRDGHPGCTYGNIIVNMQRAGALGVIFSASPGNDVEVITPTEADFQHKVLYDAVLAYDNYNGQPQDQHLPAPLRRRQAAASSASSAVGSSRGDTDMTLLIGRMAGDGDEVATAAAAAAEDTDEQPRIPATMVSYSDGLDLMTLLGEAAGANVTTEVEFRVKQIPTGWFVIDPWAGLAEAGWAQLPVMMHAGWGAWWQVYLGRLRQQLQELKAQSVHNHVVAVFKDKPFPGPHGATVTAVVPRRPHRHFKRLLLDFSLGCRGPMDASCPAWDHMVQLFACCDPRPEHCRSCPTTLWKQPRQWLPQAPDTFISSPNTSAATVVQEAAAGEPPLSPQRCGLELGRWATPFRRRVGRWLTDVTSLMGLLGSGGRCSFTAQTAPWADGNWTATLSLIFVRQPPSAEQESVEAARPEVQPWGLQTPAGTNWAEQEHRDHLELVEEDGGKLHHNRRRHGLAVQKLRGVQKPRWAIPASAAASTGAVPAPSETPLHRGLRPFSILPLFDSATFDASYNTGRSEMVFPTPSRTRTATIVSYITGHGSTVDTGCCEFYPTSHHLFVNGLEVAVLNFTDAGTSWGCADAVLYGGVPNQHGTWVYGRGGWCDGAAVQPWVVDVSRVLRPPGSVGNNTVRYKGLFGDRREPIDPPGVSPAGYIMMQSLLVLYE